MKLTALFLSLTAIALTANDSPYSKIIKKKNQNKTQPVFIRRLHFLYDFCKTGI